MSNIDKHALRERYSEKPSPKCHICGAVMSIQAAGAGGVTYGCTGRIDKDGEGYKFAEGRHFADDHYARSRVTDYSPSGDPEVLALLDELEAAKQDSAKWFKAFEKAVSIGARYEERIAELEARTLTVKLPDIMPPEAAPAHYWNTGESMAYADGYNKSTADLKTSFALACSSAGVNVEFE